jgi:hypothetical protein
MNQNVNEKNCPHCDFHLKKFTKTHDWDGRKYHLKCWKSMASIVYSLDLNINGCRDEKTKEYHIRQKREIINNLNKRNIEKIRQNLKK